MPPRMRSLRSALSHLNEGTFLGRYASAVAATLTVGILAAAVAWFTSEQFRAAVESFLTLLITPLLISPLALALVVALPYLLVAIAKRAARSAPITASAVRVPIGGRVELAHWIYYVHGTSPRDLDGEGPYCRYCDIRLDPGDSMSGPFRCLTKACTGAQNPLSADKEKQVRRRAIGHVEAVCLKVRRMGFEPVVNPDLSFDGS